MQPKLHQPFSQFQNDIIFVDGLWGSGKSLLVPIIASLRGVQRVQIIEHLDYPLQLFSIKHLGFEEACTLSRYSIDILSYNTQIGRGINLRWNDWSSLNLNTSGFKYIRRLFSKDGDEAMQRLDKSSNALLLMPHYILPSLDVLRSTLGSRLKYMFVLRHPLFVFHHWHTYFQRYLSKREFTLSIDHSGIKVPWFCAGHLPEDIGDFGSETRTITLLTAAYRGLLLTLNTLLAVKRVEDSKDILVVDFEKICYDTELVLKQVSNFTGRVYGNSLRKTLEIERLPRQSQIQGRGLTGYGFDPKLKTSDTLLKSSILNRLESSVPSTAFQEFTNIINNYNSLVSTL